MKMKPNGKSRLLIIKAMTARLMIVAEILLFLLSGVVLASDSVAPRGKPVDVLMIGFYTCNVREAGWPKLQAACAAQGVRLSILGEGVAEPLDFPRFTPAFLKQFQVVIFIGLPEVDHPENPANEEVAKTLRYNLDTYYKAGGSIIWSPLGIGHGGVYWTNLVGKRYDAQGFDEALYDPGKEVFANPLFKTRTSYIWTSDVTPHPVTDGVKGLLLPEEGDWSWPGTVPMKFGQSWTTLIQGMDTTRTIWNAQPFGSGQHDFKPELQGTYSGSPEIVGVRDSINGSGRMMVFPFFPAHTWKNYGNWAMGDAMMLNGAGGHPSDGMKLFINACKWLAEPAQKAGMGGYVAPKGKGSTVMPPLDWAEAGFAGNSWSGAGTWWNARTQEDVAMKDLDIPDAKQFKGVIGVRTSASDGEGTVAEDVAQAKKLGLSFIVFLENLEKIDDARYAKVVAECKANSSADFVAVPGYLYRDTANTLFFIFNVEHLPEAENLTPDRHVKVPNILTITSVGYQPQGIAELGKMKMDPWYLLSYSCIAPYVYDGGKLVDDGVEGYRSLQGRMHEQTPVSLTIIRKPSDLQATVDNAYLTVIHAVKATDLMSRLKYNPLWNPNPIYISSGPQILRWGVLNPIGQPFAPGKQRTRFVLEAQSPDGIADVKIIEARSGKLFRHFKPEGAAKTFSCTIDETHKDQWYLFPVVIDGKGRTALGPTLMTYQDGNRISPYRDNIDAGDLVIGWDDKHQKLLQFGGWLGAPWHQSEALSAGDLPANTQSEALWFSGFDGGAISGSHCEVEPEVITDEATEPKISAYRFENQFASFDYAAGDYIGNDQFLNKPFKNLGWFARSEPQVPMEYADVLVRVGAVHARYHAPESAKINEVIVTFKKDCTLKRINIGHMWRSYDWGPMFVAVKDQDGESSWQDDGKDNVLSHRGVLKAGDYVVQGTDYGGAPAVINMGDTPLNYEYGSQRTGIYLDGGGRHVKAGEKIVARFLMLQKPWEGQNNSLWLKKFIADFAVGGGQPGYTDEVTQGKLKEINYVMSLDAENGGATVLVKRYNLPHNLLVQVNGIPPNAIAGRYDRDRKQLLILPVYHGAAITSINTMLGDTRLYAGELFHCDDGEVVLSCVQDGADKLLVEIHNPTGKPKTVRLMAVPGFDPLASLSEGIQVKPYSSEKQTFQAATGSLQDTPYQGE